jgi:hypothetical protein
MYMHKYKCRCQTSDACNVRSQLFLLNPSRPIPLQSAPSIRYMTVLVFKGLYTQPHHLSIADMRKARVIIDQTLTISQIAC